MTSQFKEKAVRLGKLMNGKSKFAIPLVQCILDCFEIVYTEEEIDCMLLMGAGKLYKGRAYSPVGEELWGYR